MVISFHNLIIFGLVTIRGILNYDTTYFKIEKCLDTWWTCFNIFKKRLWNKLSNGPSFSSLNVNLGLIFALCTWQTHTRRPRRRQWQYKHRVTGKNGQNGTRTSPAKSCCSFASRTWSWMRGGASSIQHPASASAS